MLTFRLWAALGDVSLFCGRETNFPSKPNPKIWWGWKLFEASDILLLSIVIVSCLWNWSSTRLQTHIALGVLHPKTVAFSTLLDTTQRVHPSSLLHL